MEVSYQLHVPTALLPGGDPGIQWTGSWVGSGRIGEDKNF